MIHGQLAKYICRKLRQYTAVLFLVLECAVPCFERYHTLQNYVYDDESRDGARPLKEGRGRPYQRGRRRSLRN